MRLGNKLMKRLSLYLFLILFTLQTPSQADDIRDFQIEGLSVGDSLLDYFSEEKINKSKRNYGYKDKKFYAVGFDNENVFTVYDSLDIYLKHNDKNYIIYSISGINYFINDINNCYKKKKEISSELTLMFNDLEKKELKKKKMSSYKSSTIESNYFIFRSGDYVKIQCYDWSEKITKEKKWGDHLRIAIGFKEYYDRKKN